MTNAKLFSIMKSELSKKDKINLKTSYGEFVGDVISVDKTDPQNSTDYSIKVNLGNHYHRFWSHEIETLDIIEKTKSPEKVLMQQWTDHQIVEVNRGTRPISVNK